MKTTRIAVITAQERTVYAIVNGSTTGAVKTGDPNATITLRRAMR